MVVDPRSGQPVAVVQIVIDFDHYLVRGLRWAVLYESSLVLVESGKLGNIIFLIDRNNLLRHRTERCSWNYIPDKDSSRIRRIEDRSRVDRIAVCIGSQLR